MTNAEVEAVWRSDSRRVLATLIRVLGDFDLAEEALHDAFAAALAQWPRDGVPRSPRAWLVSTGHRSSAAANASCSASSARSKSPRRRMSVARTRRDSAR